MATDRDPEPVHLVKEDVINHPRLTVGQDNTPADQLRLGSMKFSKDVRRSFGPVIGHGHALRGWRISEDQSERQMHHRRRAGPLLNTAPAPD